MNIITGEAFIVVGLHARTSNAQEMTDAAIIPQLWEQLMERDALERIPNRLGSGIIALYTGYESDANGAYTYVLGAMAATADCPQNMVAKKVPGGTYAVITSDRGPVAEVVLGAWKRIWSDSELSARRSYAADFEVYDHRATNPQDAQIDIYVGIR